MTTLTKSAEHYSTKPNISCTIQTVTFPKLFTSLFFGIWRHGHQKGKTKFYKGSSLTVEIGESFVIDMSAAKSHPLRLYWYLKAMTGEITQLTEFIIALPSIQDINDGLDISPTMSTQFGQIAVKLHLDLKFINDLEAGIETELKKTEVTTAYTDYKYLAENNNVFPKSSEEVTRMWGDKGFVVCAETIQYGPFDKEVFEGVKNLQETINNFSQESKRCSNIISLVLLKIMDPKPTFIDANGKQCQLAPPAKCFPSILRDICDFIRKANESTEMAEKSIDSINAITQTLAEYAKSKTIQFEALISIISAAYGAVSYIEKYKMFRFEKVKSAFSELGRQSLMALLAQIQEDVNILIKSPQQFCDKLSRIGQNLQALGIPENTIERVDNEMLAVCDFFVTRTWIMNEDMGIKSLLAFTGAWPQYQFIMLNALIDIIQFCKDIVSGAIQKKSLHPAFQGIWLTESLKKLANKNKITPQQIKALMIDESQPVPSPPKMEDCVKEILNGSTININVPETIFTSSTDQQ